MDELINEIAESRTLEDIFNAGQKMITYFENTDYYILKRNYEYILSNFFCFFYICYANHYKYLTNRYYGLHDHNNDTQIFLITDYIKDHEEYFNIFIKIIDIIYNLMDESSLNEFIRRFTMRYNVDEGESILVNVLLSLVRCDEFSLNLIPDCSILNYANDQINIIIRSI